ncbi:hypothetical protein Tco_1067356 [Tanacetum coccineum]|uniref:Uncharacterized protein n=1 Tax=Tanacetum coccineum TaxID=301880 RepID=A0ABQ5HDI6_9ASTR
MDEDIPSDDDKTNSSMITKPEIKIGDEFLKILHDNSFNVEMLRNGGTVKEQLLLGRSWANVKSGLWEFYVIGQTKGRIDDLVNYNEPCEECSKKTCSDLFFKPYLDAQDGKDIYEIIDRDYSPIPIPAHHDISNPNKQCQTKEFTVIQRISLTGFPAQSVGSSNTDVLDSPCLLVLITGTSQSRQHGFPSEL